MRLYVRGRIWDNRDRQGRVRRPWCSIRSGTPRTAKGPACLNRVRRPMGFDVVAPRGSPTLRRSAGAASRGSPAQVPCCGCRQHAHVSTSGNLVHGSGCWLELRTSNYSQSTATGTASCSTGGWTPGFGWVGSGTSRTRRKARGSGGEGTPWVLASTFLATGRWSVLERTSGTRSVGRHERRCWRSTRDHIVRASGTGRGRLRRASQG
jgi:hypothetical protein